MDEHPERRRYYPSEENVPLSVTIREAIEAHENSSLSADELSLYEHVNPEALDVLFRDTTDEDVDVSVQINLTNVTVSVWSDGAVDVRVTDKHD